MLGALNGFPSAGEDEPDHLLKTNVGMEAEPGFSIPHRVKRNRDPQIASASVGPSAVQHPRPERAEFELADAALHAEELAIVGSARIVYAVVVDDARFDRPAEFEQVMLVAPLQHLQPASNGELLRYEVVMWV